MPTVSVGRDLLFEALGRTYTQDEFQELCFRFGIELDDVTTEKEIIRKEKHLKEDDDFDGGEEIIYKIEVPANRYDLLCLEGLVQSLRIFCGVDSVPNYTLASISKQSMLKMHTSSIRPYVVCAVLRAITFNEARYNSFIGLQDKLHQNICSHRTLVAIGTHDLDTIEGPFTYEALPPTEIEFKPLKQVESFRADKLMEFYKSDLKLNKYLHIIKDSPVYPVIYDRNRRVLSLPPIINGAHSAISLKTKNVFIECTATDLTKAKIVLNTMVTMFSVYCEKKFEVEPVEVIYSDGKTYVCPDLSPYDMEVSLPYINGIVGVSLETRKVAELLNKMQLEAKKSVSSDNECIFTVSVPGPTRSDVLHACDVAEDVAIAYGYNEIPKQKPSSIKPLLLNEFNEHIPLSLNQFRDLIIDEVAMYGFSQVILFNLCSYKNHFPMLNRKDDKSTVIIANPSSVDCQVSQSSLMTGMLKTLAHSKDHAKPIKIFEVADVVLLDELKDVGASNQLHLAALYCNSGNPFEADGDKSGYHYYMRVIQGLVDRIMEVTGNPFESGSGYYIVESDEPEFLPGGQAAIILEGERIGAFGVVHPQVLENFGIQNPCSFVELNLESVQLHANEIPKRKPSSIKPLPLNQFSKHIILEIAMCGYEQVKAFNNLCSYKDFSHMLNREDEKSTVATDFEVMRCIVMAGMLKTFAHRKDDAKPIKIFEVGDVVLSAELKDGRARNHRHLGAVYCGATSGFELIHGLVDRIMEATGYPFVSSGDNTGYYIVKSDAPEFLSGRQATIILKGKPIGTFGILHPQVLENFGTQDPCSFVNLNVESLL